MTNTTPPDWVLIEAAKRSDWRGKERELGFGKNQYHVSPTFRALCDMIAKYEQPPAGRKVLCAREAMALAPYMKAHDARDYREGKLDAENQSMANCIRAIELFEDGFGK